jgi:hypothetical protein
LVLWKVLVSFLCMIRFVVVAALAQLSTLAATKG